MAISPSLHSTLYKPIAHGNDLLERVKRNAVKLRAMWESGDGEDVVSFEQLQTKRWNRRNKTPDPPKIKKRGSCAKRNPEIKSAPMTQISKSQRAAVSVPNKQDIESTLFQIQHSLSKLIQMERFLLPSCFREKAFHLLTSGIKEGLSG